MNIINRYLTLQIINVFWLVLGMVIGIYMAVDFLEKVDDFLEAGLGMGRMAQFLFYEIPFIVIQIMPVALLLSVLIVIGIMNRQNEMVALRSCGVSVFRLLRPVAALGVVFSLLQFGLAEFVVPLTMEKANRIWTVEVRKSSAMTSREKNIWIRGNRSITFIEFYEPYEKTLYGVTFHQFDEQFRLSRRLDAKRADFDAGAWVLSDVLQQRFFRDGRPTEMTYMETANEDLGIQLEDLSRVAKASVEMGLFELGRYIEKIEQEGYAATAYRVDYYAKFSFPVVCLIMSLVGIGIAIRARLKEGLAVSVVYGIGVAFLYWVFHSFCMSLGYGEILPAWVAAWAANVIFFCVGALLLMHAE